MFVSVYLAFQTSISMFHATVQLSYMEKMKCVLPFLYIVDVYIKYDLITIAECGNIARSK